jgi:hypothetical protein
VALKIMDKQLRKWYGNRDEGSHHKRRATKSLPKDGDEVNGWKEYQHWSQTWPQW